MKALDKELLCACVIGDVDKVKDLLEKGADVNERNCWFETSLCNDGTTPLHEACWNGCADVVKLLLEAGADVNITNMHGWTPLHWACKYGHADIVNLLLKAGADVNAVHPEYGDIPLHWACYGGYTYIVKALLEAGSDLHAKSTAYSWNASGDTPLSVARITGHMEIEKLLLAALKEENLEKNNSNG